MIGRSHRASGEGVVLVKGSPKIMSAVFGCLSWGLVFLGLLWGPPI